MHECTWRPGSAARAARLSRTAAGQALPIQRPAAAARQRARAMAQGGADGAAAGAAGPAQASAPGSASSAGYVQGGGVTPGIGERTEDLCGQIAQLQQEQKTIREKRARVTKDLKNAKRRKTRLTTTAERLSDEDLVAVMQMRADIRTTKQQAAGQSGPSDEANEKPSAAD